MRFIHYIPAIYIQYSRAQRREYERRDHGAPGGIAQYRRREGCDRRSHPPDLDTLGDSQRFQPDVRRGRHGDWFLCPGRARMHLRHGQRCAARLRGILRRLESRRRG